MVFCQSARNCFSIANLFYKLVYLYKEKWKTKHLEYSYPEACKGDVMRTAGLIFSLVLFLVSTAEGGVLLKTKDGKTLKWKNYTDEGNDYCTVLSVGKFCVPKKTIISISGESEDYGTESPEEIEKRKLEKEQYLKEKEKEQKEWKIKENLTKIKEGEQKRVDALNACLNSASARYEEDWNSHCSKKGFGPKCALPSSTVLVLDQRFRDSKDECHRAYNLK